MEKGLKLSREYIQVKRQKNGELTFGGDQGFFAGAQRGSADEKKEKFGCGIIALSDLFLYLANKNSRFVIEQNMSYVNHALLQEEYQKYYNSIYKFLGGIPLKGGVSGIKLQCGFNRMARRKKWPVRARWCFSGKKLYRRIEEMLEKDIPVILCIPMLLRKKDKERKLPFYIREENGFKQVLKMSAHYVTVTEIIIEKEDAVFLEISSWGKKYYIKWEEYDYLIHTVFLGTILGNILYIRDHF